MANRFNHNKVSLYRGFALPVIAIIAMIFVIITMVKINSQLSRNSFYAINGTQENYSWAVAKLSMQLSQFETLLIQKKYDDSVSTSQISRKLDILFSRVNVLRTRSESTQFLYLQNEYEQTINHIYEMLELVDEENKVKNPDYKLIASQATSLQPYVSYLANIADHAEVMQRTASLNDFLDKRNTLRILLALTSAICIILLFMSVIHHHSLYKALLSERKSFNNKNAFLGKMGHELRTSLQAVIGSIDVLSQNTNDFDSEVIKRLENAAVQIEQQMNDLAEYAKIDNGMIPLNLSVFNLKKTIDAVIQNYMPKNNNIKINIDYSKIEEIYIKTDQSRLIQIVENLFTNALKYTREGSISVSARYSKELILSVKDTGYGIPKDQLNDVFTPFFRADINESKIPGFGMGLAIVEGLVKALKGSITVNSIEGKGSEFIVKIPVDLEKPNSEDEYNINSIRDLKFLSSLNLLIIDDNDLSCSTISSMMTSHGLKCETTTDPTRALQKLARKPYDLVLCDLQMPIMTGDKLLKFIRDNSGPNQETPFIFISAYADRFSIMDTKILSKPVRSADIFDEISRIFGL